MPTLDWLNRDAAFRIADQVPTPVLRSHAAGLHFSVEHDYIHVFAKSASAWTPNPMSRSDEYDEVYKNPDNDVRGGWRPDSFCHGGAGQPVGGVPGRWLPGAGQYRPCFPLRRALLSGGRHQALGGTFRFVPKELEKAAVGQVWAERSAGRALFAMVFKQDRSLNVVQQLDAAVAPAPRR